MRIKYVKLLDFKQMCAKLSINIKIYTYNTK